MEYFKSGVYYANVTAEVRFNRKIDIIPGQFLSKLTTLLVYRMEKGVLTQALMNVLTQYIHTCEKDYQHRSIIIIQSR